MALAFQTLVTGLAIGGIYSLMAVGYSLIFSILNFSNFAYGGIIMLASFMGYYAMTLLRVNLGIALFPVSYTHLRHDLLHRRYHGSQAG